MVHFQKFGQYEIVRKLSRSMTDVYLARDTGLNRPVVLKIIEHAEDEFTQIIIEAERRGSQLQRQLHDLDKRILQIYDCGDLNNCFFVAMEYFEGRTVAELLGADKKFEAKRAARYAAEICSQLRTLHSFQTDITGKKAAVVHGDIKPSNVQIGLDDELRLLDFGITKVITFTHNLTHHNLGSPSYCSPERISKSQVDQQSDLWALGVTLYEMLAGTPPYQAQNTRKLESLIQSRRAPRALPPECPAPIQAIVSKSLSGDIHRRYQSAQQFEAYLRAFLSGSETLAEREKAGSSDFSNVTIALLAGILTGLLIFIPIGYYYRSWSAAKQLRARRDYAHQNSKTIGSDWALYQTLKKNNRLLGELSPVAELDGEMHANLLAAGENVLETFRSSSDAQLSDFDWAKARLCLKYALAIEPADTKAKADLALCAGYMNLAENPKPPRAALSIDDFRQAESYIPHSADPHLGLARVYVYAFHNVGQAMA